MRKFIALAMAVLALAACSSDGGDEASAEPAGAAAGTDGGAEAWCATLDARPDAEMDPADPASVEATFAFNLQQAEERAAIAPDEIAEAAQAMLAETERFVAVLEGVDWDLEAAGDQAMFPPEAQAASDAILDFEVEHCGVSDPRG